MNGQPVAFYAALSLAAGVLIPIMAALNGAMGRTLANPQLASLIAATAGFLMVAAFTLMSGGLRAEPGAIAQITPLQWVAGLGLAFYITAITFLAPRFGVGNAVMLVVAAQIATSATIDHWGLFGAPQKPIDLMRALGLAIMVFGVVIAQLAASKPGAR